MNSCVSVLLCFSVLVFEPVLFLVGLVVAHFSVDNAKTRKDQRAKSLQLRNSLQTTREQKGPADQELVVAQFTADNAKTKRDQRTNSW